MSLAAAAPPWPQWCTFLGDHFAHYVGCTLKILEMCLSIHEAYRVRLANHKLYVTHKESVWPFPVTFIVHYFQMIRINVIPSGVRRTMRRDQKLLQKQLTVLKIMKAPGREERELFSKILKRLLLMSSVSCHILLIVAMCSVVWRGAFLVDVNPPVTWTVCLSILCISCILPNASCCGDSTTRPVSLFQVLNYVCC